LRKVANRQTDKNNNGDYILLDVGNYAYYVEPDFQPVTGSFDMSREGITLKIYD